MEICVYDEFVFLFWWMHSCIYLSKMKKTRFGNDIINMMFCRWNKGKEHCKLTMRFTSIFCILTIFIKTNRNPWRISVDAYLRLLSSPPKRSILSQRFQKQGSDSETPPKLWPVKRSIFFCKDSKNKDETRPKLCSFDCSLLSYLVLSRFHSFSKIQKNKDETRPKLCSLHSSWLSYPDANSMSIFFIPLFFG